MKVVALVSGGKDSCFAMMRCLDFGHEVVALANLIPLDDSVDELDSYMYQTVGHQIVVSYAKCMGLPLFRRRIKGSTRDQHLNYTVTPGDEVEDMFILLHEVKRQIPSVDAVSSGAIASDYQRLRVESVCSRLGLVSLAYLWKQDQTLLLEEMIRRGIVAITVKVAAMGLRPAAHLGKELADLKSHLLQMNESYGINVCGEGGEYETLTLDCPLFCNARIILDKFQVILHSPDSIAPVGVLHPLAFHLEHKPDSSGRTLDDPVAPELCEAEGGVPDIDVLDSLILDPSSSTDAYADIDLHITRTGRNLFSVGCCIQDSSRALRGLKEDLASVLSRIELQLMEEGLSWVNVLYVHLYISSIKEFALANEVYVSFITEKKCYLGVPSRSTIELPLVQVGLGSAYVEVLVANELVKRVLHVQSISCWAPSCIGPYSQATLHREVLYMAGQLGLDPPTMKLCSGGSTAELELALRNSEAVADCFSTSIFSSTIHFVVYCSARLTSSERSDVIEKMQNSFGARLDGSRNVLDPTILYILASDLPKGAGVEVKPMLYIPSKDDGVVAKDLGTGDVQPALKFPCAQSSQNLEFMDSCCQILIVHGKICSAILSITNDLAVRICPTTEPWHVSEKHLKVIAKYCVFWVAKILEQNNFSWHDLMMLRFYYPAEHSLAADTMASIYSEAFAELGNFDDTYRTCKEPIFNLVPALGSGSSASMDDVITCELFASKV